MSPTVTVWDLHEPYLILKLDWFADLPVNNKDVFTPERLDIIIAFISKTPEQGSVSRCTLGQIESGRPTLADKFTVGSCCPVGHLNIQLNGRVKQSLISADAGQQRAE